MNAQQRVVIVGASLAGLQAAQTLRRGGFDGDVVMVGDESHYPYDRPPLSKQFLAGSWEEEKLRLRAAVDPDELGLRWCLGVAAVGLDLERRLVSLADGSTEAYDGLVIATGARPRLLGGLEPGGPVHVLRSLDDARRLRDALGGARRVCVIGAGFIGAEVAATARERGVEVTMIEAAAAPLARVLDGEAGMAIADLHRGHGVDVRLGVGVETIDVISPDDPATVWLSDGSSVAADVVVVGIGVIPNTEWLVGSGLEIDNGVVADEYCRAAPGVFVAGDVARWKNERYGELMRVEQWDNAIDQGAHVARNLAVELAGDDPAAPFTPVPWFWSDQYDRKIQLAGIPGAAAQVVNGSIDEQRFVQIYADADGTFVGALAWNRPRQAIQSRQLLESGATMAEAVEELGE